MTAVLFGVSFAVVACTNYTGTYSAEGGMMTIELKSGGQATFNTAMGESDACTWSSSGKTVKMTCANQSLDFAVNSDGSLTAPVFGTLKKTK